MCPIMQPACKNAPHVSQSSKMSSSSFSACRHTTQVSDSWERVAAAEAARAGARGKDEEKLDELLEQVAAATCIENSPMVSWPRNCRGSSASGCSGEIKEQESGVAEEAVPGTSTCGHKGC